MYHVGMARRDMTPALGMRLVGYLDRRSVSGRAGEPIFVNALVVKGEHGSWVLCSCDTLGVPRALVNRVRSAISLATGIAAESVWIAPSHTHSAPPTFPGAQASDSEARWAAELERALVETAVEAWREAVPARLFSALCRVEVGVNRRPLTHGRVVEMGAAPDRPVDHAVPVLIARTQEGEPIGCLVGVACHPVACGRDTDLMTSDYPGAMRTHLEEAGLGQCHFALGACGDVNPAAGIHEDPGVADEIGRGIATAVAEAAGTAIPLDGEVVTSTRLLTVTYTPPPASPGATHLEDVTGDDSDGVLGALDGRFPWDSAATSNGEVEVEVAVARIGELWLAALPYEVFAQAGLEVRGLLGDRSFLVTLANGSVGYLPVDDELTRGGYEVDESYLLYRLPGPPPRGTSGRLVATIAELKGSL